MGFQLLLVAGTRVWAAASTVGGEVRAIPKLRPGLGTTTYSRARSHWGGGWRPGCQPGSVPGQVAAEHGDELVWSTSRPLAGPELPSSDGVVRLPSRRPDRPLKGSASLAPAAARDQPAETPG